MSAMQRSQAGQPSAYRIIVEDLRRELGANRYADGKALPTEAELAATYGVSRQTVRRAMHDLVADGSVYRVAGRGTFANPREYVRQFGSIDELMGLSIDTILQIVDPLEQRIDVEAAGRLRLDADLVAAVTFRRMHLGRPICYTTVTLPPAIGQRLEGVKDLETAGAESDLTVISLLDDALDKPIVEARQSISVSPVPDGIAEAIGCSSKQQVLKIDRIYFDEAGVPVELAVSWFDPEIYSYRVHLRRSR
jgi:DNA-binding GntR family transcriptional regulator